MLISFDTRYFTLDIVIFLMNYATLCVLYDGRQFILYFISAVRIAFMNFHSLAAAALAHADALQGLAGALNMRRCCSRTLTPLLR